MSGKQTLFFLHGLGCSARLWRFVEQRLGDRFDCVALDLPGHGANASSDLLTVAQMSDFVLAEIIRRAPERWGVVGHSMGGKVAAIVTRRAERGLPGLVPPTALALVAASPLSPEPMGDDARAQMLGWASDGPVAEKDAQSFVDANTAARLPDELRDAAVTDVRAVSREAWLAWFERGSREDWRDYAAPVHTRALVVAGAADGDLNADAQRRLVLPNVDADQVHVVEGAAHLIPLEAPDRLAELLVKHFADAGFDDMLSSDRVSARTRSLLVDRVADPAPSGVLDDQQRETLAALLARVLPQRRTDIDLVARLDAQLASAASDGWRFADLPLDAEAWRAGLDTLAAHDFGVLAATEQDRLLDRVAAGDVGGSLTSVQMTLWFEDVRAEAVRTWLAHPAAQAAIGYDGYANGGDGVRLSGYQLIGAGEHEPWQRPLPQVNR